MNNKYVMINGFAFSEESDMEKLREYAKKGWILEGIVAGFFYKFKKDKPQDIEYSLDYQDDATKEYFDLFLEAGWTQVVTLGNQIHIFSAPAGTKPIYSERESEIDKYARMKKQVGKRTIYSLIAIITLSVLLAISAVLIKPIFLLIFSLCMVSIFVFIFNFLPYLSYNSLLKKLMSDNKSGKSEISNTGLWKIYAFLSVCFLVIGIMDLSEKKYFVGGIFTLVGIFDIISTVNFYNKRNKSIQK